MSWVACSCRCLLYPLILSTVLQQNQAMYIKPQASFVKDNRDDATHLPREDNLDKQEVLSVRSVEITSNDQENNTLASANETYYRKYVPLKRMPPPDRQGDLGTSNFSKEYVIYDPSSSLYSEEGDQKKVNLIILPLCTLLVMFMYVCIKVTHWCGEDIRETDDKMLRFFLPSHHNRNDNDTPTRMPRRTNSVRSKASQSTFRSNSFRSTDTERSIRFCNGCRDNDVGLDSPLARKILIRQNKRYQPPIGLAPATSSTTSSRRQPGGRRLGGKSKSRDSLRSKKSNKERKASKRSNRKRREYELKLISMPLERHFSHMMLGRNPDMSCVSTPSSASPSTSTGLSESVPQIPSVNSDSRKTSMDSGAVALGSQSSSQTDVTSTADTTTTTTGFSSESMSSPVGCKSPMSSKHVRSKGFVFPEPLPTSKSFWEHRRLVCSRSSEAPTHLSSEINDGYIEDPFILPLYGDRYSIDNSSGSSSVLSPKDADEVVDLFSKSPRSSHSSDTAATVRYSPSKSRRSSYGEQQIGSHENSLKSKSSDSLTFQSHCSLALPRSNQQDYYVLTDISPPPSAISQHSVNVNSRDKEISLRLSQRDLADTDSNKLKKSLSADVSCDSFGHVAGTWRPQRRSLDIDTRCYEMDCFKIHNIHRTWCDNFNGSIPCINPKMTLASPTIKRPDALGLEHYC